MRPPGTGLGEVFRGAVVMPATLTMVATAYRDTGPRTRALALWSAVGAGGAAAATVAGGVLTDLAGWRWGSWTSARVTPNSITSATALTEELERIRELGIQ